MTFQNNLSPALKREQFEPENIWNNVDETGVTTDRECPKVIASKKVKAKVALVTLGERGLWSRCAMELML